MIRILAAAMRSTTTQTARPSRHWRTRAPWPALLMVAIFFASGESEVAAPGFIPGFDKLAHFGVFGLLATLVVRLFFDEGRRWRSGLIAAVLVSLYGFADEYRQSFTPGRSVEVADWVADTAGAIVAVALYCGWPGWRTLWERPIGAGRDASDLVGAGAGEMEMDATLTKS